MSKTSERLDNYITQMQEQANQHSMILASDVMVMLEQLKDDLKDDTDNIVAELEEESFPTHENYSAIWFDKAIDIVRKSGISEPTENKEADTR